MENKKVTPFLFGIGSLVAASLGTSVSADEDENFFVAQALDADTITGSHEGDDEGECGEGECGEKDGDGEGECGEGECGEEGEGKDEGSDEDEGEEESEEE